MSEIAACSESRFTSGRDDTQRVFWMAGILTWSFCLVGLFLALGLAGCSTTPGKATSSLSAIMLSPSALNFGSQTKGAVSVPETLTVANAGAAPVTVSSVNIVGPNRTDFTESNNCPETLAPHNSCAIIFTFKPSTAAVESALVTVSAGSTAEAQTASLTGTGVSDPRVPFSAMTLSPSALNFGSQTQGTSSAPETLTVANAGAAPVMVSSVNIAGPNSADFTENNNCLETLAPHNSCAITFTFKPSTAAAESALVTVSAGSTAEAQTASLSGTGTTNGASSPGRSGLPVALTIQESIYGDISGINRSGDPVTLGVPISDSSQINNISQLGIAGASVGQFRVLGQWPSGNIKWLLVDTQADVPAGGQNTAISLTTGTGSFGGATLATDNGSTITVNTGTATFTIKKANFDLIDQAVVNGKSLLTSGSSGLVVLGPNPGSATCPCSTLYSSSNDPDSTAVVEENGPVRAAIKATGQHKDVNGNAYMRYTVRLQFYKNQSYVKIVSQLQNADYSASNGFISAYKGFTSYEARLTPALASGRSFSFGSSGAPVLGSFAGSENAYLYQAYSNNMEDCSWNDPDRRPQYAPRSYIARTQISKASCSSAWNYAQEGYEVVHSGTAVGSGSGSQYAQGWADLSDSSGAGIEIGIDRMSAYWPKSLQFMSGGSEARIGIWPDQSLFLSGGGQSYFQSWPEYSIHTLFINFHSSALSDPSAEFLKFQYHLIARAPLAQYNASGVIPFTVPDPSEEDGYYKSLGMACCITDTASPHIFRNYDWASPGGGNQSEFRWADLILWLQRGYTGRYVNSADFYRFQTEQVFPRSDYNGATPFHWRDASVPASVLDPGGFPVVSSSNNSSGCDPGETQCGRNWIDDQHAHWYGMMDYYFMTGDESIKDAIEAGASDKFGNPNIAFVQKGLYWASRNIGEALMSDARLYEFYSAIGDSSDAANSLAAGDLILQNQVWPDMQVSGFGTAPQGVSQTRGLAWGCCGTPRWAKPFQLGILNQGLWEYLQAHGTSWPKYQQTFDLAYGIANFTLTEAWRSGTFQNGCDGGTGMAYQILLDQLNNPLPASCDQTVWFNFYIAAKYTGNPNAWDGWSTKFPQQLSRLGGGHSFFDEYGTINIGTMVNEVLHPETTALVNVPLTVQDLGSGSNLLSWTVPIGAVSYRLKYSDKNIVDWLNFNPVTNIFAVDPNANVPWFAATDVSNAPVPATPGSTQQYSVAGLGSTPWHFALEAYVSASTPPDGSKVSQTSKFVSDFPPTAAYGSSFTVAATASSGLPITYGSSGSCTNVAAIYTITNGSGTCTISISQSGNNGYLAAPTITQSITAIKASQTATFTVSAPSFAHDKSSFTVSVTTSSGLAVTYSSSGVCTNVGATYTMTSTTGNCSVTASQAGDSDYLAAIPVSEVTSTSAGTGSQPPTWLIYPSCGTPPCGLPSPPAPATGTHSPAGVGEATPFRRNWTHMVYIPAVGEMLIKLGNPDCCSATINNSFWWLNDQNNPSLTGGSSAWQLAWSNMLDANSDEPSSVAGCSRNGSTQIVVCQMYLSADGGTQQFYDLTPTVGGANWAPNSIDTSGTVTPMGLALWGVGSSGLGGNCAATLSGASTCFGNNYAISGMTYSAEYVQLCIQNPGNKTLVSHPAYDPNCLQPGDGTTQSSGPQFMHNTTIGTYSFSYIDTTPYASTTDKISYSTAGTPCNSTTLTTLTCWGGPFEAPNIEEPHHPYHMWTYDNTDGVMLSFGGAAEGTGFGGLVANQPFCSDCATSNLTEFAITGSNIDPTEICGELSQVDSLNPPYSPNGIPPCTDASGSATSPPYFGNQYPRPDTEAAVVWDDCNNQLILAGGTANSAASFTFNLVTKVWTEQAQAWGSFQATHTREGLVWVHEDGLGNSQCAVYMIYGGSNATTPINEVWKGIPSPGGATIDWELLTFPGATPEADLFPVVDLDPDPTSNCPNGFCMIYITQNQNPTASNQVWQFDPSVYASCSASNVSACTNPSTNAWTQLTTANLGPTLATGGVLCEGVGACHNEGGFNRNTHTFDLMIAGGLEEQNVVAFLNIPPGSSK
jgi:hypothetical protein